MSLTCTLYAKIALQSLAAARVADSLGLVAIANHASIATPDQALPHLAIQLIWC